MKKIIAVILLSFSSAFSLFSCVDAAKRGIPIEHSEEYAAYRKSGGNLTYQEWRKERDMLNKGKGDQGVSLKSMNVNEKGELIIELNNGEKINTGVISDPSLNELPSPSL